MSLRVMATADVHLGMKFASYASLGSVLAEARFDALRRVVARANEQSCTVLVVAGDLFHRVGVAGEVVRRAAEILAEFSGDLVAILPGNHDFVSADADRLWDTFREAGGDRTLVLDEPHAYDLRVYDLNAIILAAPCDSLRGHDNRLRWMEDYPVPAGDPALIGVAHGSVEGLTLDSEGQYFPMSRSLLAELPPAVWIVGHTHRQHDVRESRLVVPGTPEPDGFDCTHTGQAAIIDLTDQSYHVEPVSTGSFRFSTIAVNLDPGRPLADQLDREVPHDALVRLSVRGSLSGAELNDLEAALDRLRAKLPYLQVERSGLRRLVSQADVDRVFADGTFAHALVSRLLRDDDLQAAAQAMELLGIAGPGDQADAAVGGPAE